MVFVDTGAWFALFVPSDPNHSRAVEWLQSNTEPLVTTDYCIDEPLTLLCVRGEHRRSLEVGRLLFEQGDTQVHFLVPQQIRRAWILFQRMHQAGWSFTDCTCKVVIDELGIETAFAFDAHFRQFGNVVVVP